MKRLLYDIQSFFTATYSGRYVAFLLGELFVQDREAFSRILNEGGIKYVSGRDHRVVANTWQLPIKDRRRFADVAVLDAAGKPLVIIEIKDADLKNDKNAAQLEDYLNVLNQKKYPNVCFLFLSRFVPPEKYERRLQSSRANERIFRMLFRQMHKPLIKSSMFGSMIRDYLEDINVAYHVQTPDQKTLNYVANTMLGLGGRKAAERSIPEFFEIAFGNLESLGQWIQGKNQNLFKQGFRRRLSVEPSTTLAD